MADWRVAVLSGLRRFAERHATRKIRRQAFITEELPAIAAETHSRGRTPAQTLSRVLQDLRDEGVLQFLGRGTYLLLDRPLDVEGEDLPDRAIDLALAVNKLRIGRISTNSAQAVVRQRRGQQRLRRLVLINYDSQCAVCDIGDAALLVTSHIVPWAEDPDARGDLRNVLCLCRFHDALFEQGYWSLTDNLKVVRRNSGSGRIVRILLDATVAFRPPRQHPPDPRFLRRHRNQWGLDGNSASDV